MRTFSYLLYFSTLLWVSSNVYPQTQSIKIIQDARIPLLVKKNIEANEYNTRDARRFVQGFRLLIINTPDRTLINDAKLKLIKVFPELKTYTEFQSPRFKLKAGNFKDNKEAAAYQKRVQPLFTQEIYIIRDIIEINPDKSASLDKQ